MARPALRARRFTATVSLAVAMLTLIACSSGSAPTAPKAAPILGNGKHYTIEGGSLAHSKWPDPCSLLPRLSGAAAVGTPVTTKRFHASCFYVPRSAAFPNLSLTLLGVGTDQSGRYDTLRQSLAKRNPRTVANVGHEAFSYTAKVQPMTTLVVLSAGALFSVGLTTPQGAGLPVTRTRALLIAVAQPVAKEFSA